MVYALIPIVSFFLLAFGLVWSSFPRVLGRNRCSIYYWKWSSKVSINVELPISSVLSIFASHIFETFVVRCMYVYNCHIFLKDWQFYNDKMFISLVTLFLICFVIKLILSDISRATSPVFWLLLALYIFSIFLLQPICCIFEPKVCLL